MDALWLLANCHRTAKSHWPCRGAYWIVRNKRPLSAASGLDMQVFVTCCFQVIQRAWIADASLEPNDVSLSPFCNLPCSLRSSSIANWKPIHSTSQTIWQLDDDLTRLWTRLQFGVYFAKRWTGWVYSWHHMSLKAWIASIRRGKKKWGRRRMKAKQKSCKPESTSRTISQSARNTPTWA